MRNFGWWEFSDEKRGWWGLSDETMRKSSDAGRPWWYTQYAGTLS
jgi:hypothetical protein